MIISLKHPTINAVCFDLTLWRQCSKPALKVQWGAHSRPQSPTFFLAGGALARENLGVPRRRRIRKTRALGTRMWGALLRQPRTQAQFTDVFSRHHYVSEMSLGTRLQLRVILVLFVIFSKYRLAGRSKIYIFGISVQLPFIFAQMNAKSEKSLINRCPNCNREMVTFLG